MRDSDCFTRTQTAPSMCDRITDIHLTRSLNVLISPRVGLHSGTNRILARAYLDCQSCNISLLFSHRCRLSCPDLVASWKPSTCFGTRLSQSQSVTPTFLSQSARAALRSANFFTHQRENKEDPSLLWLDSPQLAERI